MANEVEKQDKQQEKPAQEKLKVKIESVPLENALEALMDFGGFDLLKETIEGAGSMDPSSKARKGIFLTESGKKSEREKLKNTINLWIELLSSHENVADMISASQEKAQAASKTLNSNLKKALTETRELEANYRSVALFYKNTERDKIRNITIFNVDPDKLKDMENTLVIDKITEELKLNYDRLDLRENYSLLVIPGYLGSNAAVEKWSKIAYNNKVLLVTDFQHLDDPEAVIEEFDSAGLTGGEIYKSNVILTCNWVVGREKYTDLDEEDHLYVPPSTSLAGKIYSTLIAQPVAGKMHGGLNEINGVKFELKKSEISELERRGLVPMVHEWGKVMGMSAKTLYNGNDIGLQTYSVVRVFDYVAKVIIDFLNRQAFVNWTPKVEKDLRTEIGRFLGSIKGHDKIIESFSVIDLRQDPETKIIHLDIHITPFFPAKSFLLRLGGTKGNTAEEWVTEFSEK
ncbi:MAG TPA: type VI secretion system contractile sheath protein TssC [Bacteroidales bacterium]|nr:type VI secretion system contractile sheath protein TssC [Bacteroidales bacterium]